MCGGSCFVWGREGENVPKAFPSSVTIIKCFLVIANLCGGTQPLAFPTSAGREFVRHKEPPLKQGGVLFPKGKH